MASGSLGERLEELESWLFTHDGVEHVTTTAGKGLQRFMLTYAPEKSYAAYGEITVRVTDYSVLHTLMEQFRTHLENKYPEVNYKLKQIELGPSSGAKIEARITGSDPTILRGLARQIEDIMTMTTSCDYDIELHAVQPRWERHPADAWTFAVQ